jgi:hypothetical protein
MTKAPLFYYYIVICTIKYQYNFFYIKKQLISSIKEAKVGVGYNGKIIMPVILIKFKFNLVKSTRTP